MARDPGTGTRQTKRPPKPPSRWQGDIRPVTGMPMLKKAWKAMNLPGKPPAVFEDASLDVNDRYGGVAGYRPWDQRAVYLAPAYVDKLKTLPFPGHRDYAGCSRTSTPMSASRRCCRNGGSREARKPTPPTVFATCCKRFGSRPPSPPTCPAQAMSQAQAPTRTGQ